MSIASKYNKGTRFTTDIDSKDFEYKALKDLYAEDKDKVYTVHALYINTKGMYGDAPVILTDKFFINTPSHLTATAKEMLSDPEVIDTINAGKLGARVYEYNSKSGNTCYSVEWIDL